MDENATNVQRKTLKPSESLNYCSRALKKTNKQARRFLEAKYKEMRHMTFEQYSILK